MSKLACWVEAMRLRTLPVSVAGVIAGIAYAILGGSFKAAPALLCLAFAVLAQTASNFANEYYDYKAGLDRPGREGPRRGEYRHDELFRVLRPGGLFLTEQVGGKDERTIEYGQEHGSLAFIVTGYLRSHPAYLPAYLRLGNGHFKLLV